MTSAINCITSFLAGFVVFSVLGHMSHVSGKSVDTVARDGKHTFILIMETMLCSIICRRLFIVVPYSKIRWATLVKIVVQLANVRFQKFEILHNVGPTECHYVGPAFIIYSHRTQH